MATTTASPPRLVESIKTIPSQHKDLGSGHYMVSSVALDTDNHQAQVTVQLTSTNKLSGFHGGVEVLFYGADGKLISSPEKDFECDNAPIIGARHRSYTWNVPAPDGTAGFALAQFWHPHWALGSFGASIAGFFDNAVKFLASGFDAAQQWCQQNATACGVIQFVVFVIAATALCVAVPEGCEVVITLMG